MEEQSSHCSCSQPRSAENVRAVRPRNFSSYASLSARLMTFLFSLDASIIAFFPLTLSKVGLQYEWFKGRSSSFI